MGNFQPPSARMALSPGLTLSNSISSTAFCIFPSASLTNIWTLKHLQLNSNLVVMNVSFNIRLLGVKFWLYDTPAMRPWASNLISMCLVFPYIKSDHWWYLSLRAVMRIKWDIACRTLNVVSDAYYELSKHSLFFFFFYYSLQNWCLYFCHWYQPFFSTWGREC